MADLFNTIEVNPTDAEKLRKHLELIKQSQDSSSELGQAIGTAVEQFNQFFLDYGKPYFTAHELRLNETPQSEVYNENMQTLSQDIDRLYSSLVSASSTTLTAYNYATTVSNQVKTNAQIAASKVLDLNILNNFTKGAVIIAGDDFVNADKIDGSFGVETSRAELLNGASSITLARTGSEIVSTPDTRITVTPVLPVTAGTKIGTDPTPLNLERFYEGKFYAEIGDIRPEGANLNLQYIVDPQKIPGRAVETTVDGVVDEDRSTEISPEEALARADGVGYFAIISATEEEKQAVRRRMIDNNPATFWEAEVVFSAEPLIDPLQTDRQFSVKGAEISRKGVEEEGNN